MNKSVPDRRAIFGSLARTKILVVLNLIEESHVRELERLTTTTFTTVYRAVENLEREGVLIARTIGTTRRITFNARYHARHELRAFLTALEPDWPELVGAVQALRKRPRRTGKPL